MITKKCLFFENLIKTLDKLPVQLYNLLYGQKRGD
uniref:Uncharacterized protein n=1 Tax=Siphoviridae sp. ctR6G4 TaxID=2825499 RepID=A0A8S5NY28_9CAUD|nr:MAG TPA: hypothetical protein [Siphoviridae sp. ctR6G4]